MLAEPAAQVLFGQAGQVADCGYPQFGQIARHHRAYAPQHAHREWFQKALLLAWRHDREPARLVVVGRDLGDQLVGGHAQGGGKANLFPDPALKLVGQLDGIFPVGYLLGDVQVGLVDAHLLEQGCGLAQDGHDPPRIVAIDGKAGGQDDGLGAEDQRARHGHGRSDAVLPCRVGRRRDHTAPLRVPADEHRLARQFWILQDLDAGIKGVEVQMDDGPRCSGHTGSFQMAFSNALIMPWFRYPGKEGSCCLAYSSRWHWQVGGKPGILPRAVRLSLDREFRFLLLRRAKLPRWAFSLHSASRTRRSRKSEFYRTRLCYNPGISPVVSCQGGRNLV